MRAPVSHIIGIAPNGAQVYFKDSAEAAASLPTIPRDKITKTLCGYNKVTHGWQFRHGTPDEATAEMSVELLSLTLPQEKRVETLRHKMGLAEYTEHIKRINEERRKAQAKQVKLTAEERKRREGRKREERIRENKMKNADKLAAMKAEVEFLHGEVFADYLETGIPAFFDGDTGEKLSYLQAKNMIAEGLAAIKEKEEQGRALREGWKAGYDGKGYGPFICPVCGAVLNSGTRIDRHKKLHLKGVESVDFRGGIFRANVK